MKKVDFEKVEWLKKVKAEWKPSMFAHLQNLSIDPIYRDAIVAETLEERQAKLDLLRKIRGPVAYGRVVHVLETIEKKCM